MMQFADHSVLCSAIMEIAFDGVIISQDGVVVEASPRLLELSGYAADEVIGRPVAEFVAEEQRESVQDRHERRLAGRFDAVVVLKGGERVPIEAVSGHVDIDGRDSRVMALRDVSETRRLQEKLHHAQKLELVGRLAAGVAHDFNNLLTIIRASIALLEYNVEEADRDSIQAILDATESGAALTRELLAYGRQRNASRTAVNVNDVVRRCERMFPAVLGGHITTTVLLSPNTGAAYADPMQLQHVLLNLVVNARDAMPDGGRLIIRTRNVDVSDDQASTHSRARPGRYVMLAVADSGIGIPEPVRARMFEPFFTTKHAGCGSGLGLALVHDVVQEAGGFIVVQSSSKLGTVFAIHLPMLANDGSTA